MALTYREKKLLETALEYYSGYCGIYGKQHIKAKEASIVFVDKTIKRKK